MRKRHRIKCQNQEYQRLKQDFCIFSGCKTINLPRIIFTLVQKAVMQAMLTALPELNLFKAEALGELTVKWNGTTLDEVPIDDYEGETPSSMEEQ